MFLTDKKLSARVKELEKYRYRDSQPISSFNFKLDEEGEIGSRPPKNGEWSTIRVGEYWTGRDMYVWLDTDVQIPTTWKGKSVLGRFDFGRTGGGNNSGFESLLYLNDVPYQGVDSNHKEVFLPEDLIGEKFNMAFRLWSGLEGGGKPKEQEHKIQLAELAWLDEAADNLYYTSKAIVETIAIKDENDADCIRLRTCLDRALKLLDWAQPGSDSFYASVEAADERLREELKAIESTHPVTVHAIGHTHIDVAWLWQLKHTREKSARSFSTVLRLMEKYPDYTFLQTQPQLYDYIKHDYPEIYQQIKKRVDEGRWEIDGGMWLEADCNIPSGESLVRQILMGTQFISEEFGKECNYLWLPDVFGYSWALPQILKKSGLDTFMTTKISWNQYNRIPNDTFVWRGIDGSEILTHFITTPDPAISHLYTYNGMILPETVQGIWDAYKDKSINQDLLLSYGYGDGGGGVNREMLEMRRRLDELPGLPNVETGRVDDYFEKLHENVKNTDQYVHTWDGELYLEYHRGTYTSQAHNKLMNRKLELLYREIEWLSVFTHLMNKGNLAGYPHSQLSEGWKIILRNQFHDIIPGSSIREVYEDSRREYAEAEKIGLQEWKNAATSLVVSNQSQQNHYTVFNSSPWNRSDYITIENKANGKWFRKDGKELQAEKTDQGWIVKVEDIPSMGYSTIYLEEKDCLTDPLSEVPFSTGRDEIITPYYEISWDKFGQLTRIYDRKENRHILEREKKGNLFQIFEDKPLNHDAWDIDLFYSQKVTEVTNLKYTEIKEVNRLRAVVAFEWEYMNSVISQELIVYAANRRIDFKTKVDWHEQQQLFKVAFPLEIRSTEATFDIQYGNVKRPTHWNTSWDMAKFETVGHQWADLSEHGYGVSLLNDCKYGYDIKDNVMRLSLIKSAIHPDYQQDQGKHQFTYSLLPHSGSWVDGDTVKEAWALNQPITHVEGSSTLPEFSLFATDSDHVMIDAVKKSEAEGDKIIVRLHEFVGSRGTINIASDLAINSWKEVNLLEKPLKEKEKVTNTETIQLDISPYEVKTILIELNPDTAIRKGEVQHESLKK